MPDYRHHKVKNSRRRRTEEERRLATLIRSICLFIELADKTLKKFVRFSTALLLSGANPPANVGVHVLTGLGDG